MSPSESIPAESQEPERVGAPVPEDHGVDELLAHIDRLLTEALASRVSPSEAPITGAYHLFSGDDARVTMQQAGSQTPKELTAPQATPTRATIALPSTAVNAVTEAAAIARQHLLDGLPIEADAVQGEFTRLLQRWALVLPRDAVGRMNDIKSVVQQLRETIREWEIILPLRNLVLENSQCLEWGRLTIRPSNDIRKESIARVEAVVAQSKHPSEERDGIVAQLDGMLSYYDEVPSAVATLEVVGAVDSVERIALSEADAALNLLRCYLPLVADAEARPWFGLFGTVTEDQFLVLRFSSDRNSFGAKILTEGLLHPFRVSPELIVYLEENLAFREASQLASLPVQRRSSLQTALVVAGQFLGQAVITPEDWLSVILCTNAVELMLQMRQGQPAENAERRARVIECVIPDTVEQDLARQRLESLGRLRNQIVFRGPTHVEKTHRNAAEELAAVLWAGLVRFHSNYQSIDELLRAQNA